MARVLVSYIWDSEDNSYSPDDGSADISLQPSIDDRMFWIAVHHRMKARNGRNSRTMPLTRGFETLPYLAGLARDATTLF